MVEENKAAAPGEEPVAQDGDDVCTPWEITAATDAGINYDKLIE